MSLTSSTGSARVLPSRKSIATKAENDVETERFIIAKLKTVLPVPELINVSLEIWPV